MIAKKDAIELIRIYSKIYEAISLYQNNKITLGEMDDLVSAQIKIAYELGKASK